MSDELDGLRNIIGPLPDQDPLERLIDDVRHRARLRGTLRDQEIAYLDQCLLDRSTWKPRRIA